MKQHKQWEELVQKKENLLEDMKACITYEPHKENDLLCFMERYIKAEIGERPRLLDQIKKCMVGDSYENPFEVYYGYSVDDIERCNQLLTEFLEQCKSQGVKLWEKEREIRNLIHHLNHLNTSCQGQLIDAYRREKLLRFLEDTAKYLHIEGFKGMVHELRTW